MKRPTIDELRARLGVPPHELAGPYVAPAPDPEELDDDEMLDEGCIGCGADTMVLEGGCNLHCEGCCDCEDES